MNLHSFTPTAYQLTKNEFGYSFSTELGEEYLIYYSPADAYFPGLKAGRYALMFGFTRMNVEEGKEHESPRDSRVRATVIKEIKRYLDDDRNVLVYVCQETEKRGAAARHKLFREWFQELNDTRLIRRVTNESNGLYSSIVYCRTSPFIQELEESLPTIEEKMAYIITQSEE